MAANDLTSAGPSGDPRHAPAPSRRGLLAGAALAAAAARSRGAMLRPAVLAEFAGICRLPSWHDNA
jgi:hypothetical protein